MAAVRCTFRTPFTGTLFRFPLRGDAAAKDSNIRGVAYTPSTMLAMLNTFRQQASEALLFLKSVQRVEVYMVEEHSVVATSLFSVALQPLQGELPQAPITRFIQDVAAGKPGAFAQRLARMVPGTLPSSVSVVEITMAGKGGASESQQQWLVCNALGKGRMQALVGSLQGKAAGQGLIPWVGVAARLQLPSNMATGQPPLTHGPEVDGDAVAELASGAGRRMVQLCDAQPQADGKAFCFLPLPAKTGLPVHVNGYFELSSNRHDVWHSDVSSSQGRLRYEWNRVLLEVRPFPSHSSCA